MANIEDAQDGPPVDECLNALNAGEFRPDVTRARERIRNLDQSLSRRTRRVSVGAAAVCLATIVLPWPRAIAHQIWQRLLVNRVEVVQVVATDLPESLKAALAMEPQPIQQDSVADVAEAERIVGFRPSLPPAGLLDGTPKLSVVRRVTLSTKPLKTEDLSQALAAANAGDITVPQDWEGMTLTADVGPVFVAEYDTVELMQFAPFRMNTPAGFPFGRFMEMTFRVFGRSPDEARLLGQKFEANPALLMHFPERDPVRDVTLRSGHGILVGDPEGAEGICFFWSTADRIHIVSARGLSEQKAVALADSIR